MRYSKHIDVTVTPTTLDQITSTAEQQGTSRRALIRRYIAQGLAMDARARKEFTGE